MRIIKVRGRRKRNGQPDAMMWCVNGMAYCMTAEAAADIAMDGLCDQMKLSQVEPWPECPIAKAVAA